MLLPAGFRGRKSPLLLILASMLGEEQEDPHDVLPLLLLASRSAVIYNNGEEVLKKQDTLDYLDNVQSLLESYDVALGSCLGPGRAVKAVGDST